MGADGYTADEDAAPRLGPAGPVARRAGTLGEREAPRIPTASVWPASPGPHQPPGRQAQGRGPAGGGGQAGQAWASWQRPRPRQTSSPSATVTAGAPEPLMQQGHVSAPVATEADTEAFFAHDGVQVSPGEGCGARGWADRRCPSRPLSRASPSLCPGHGGGGLPQLATPPTSSPFSTSSLGRNPASSAQPSRTPEPGLPRRRVFLPQQGRGSRNSRSQGWEG